MGSGLSKLGTALIAVFAVCFLILAADLLYVLWRRRRFQRRSIAAGDQVLARDSSSLYILSSKELLYFFCWKNQSARIEPNQSSTININDLDHHQQQRSPDHDRDQAAAEIDVDHVMKIHDDGEGMYQNGPSRLLFTIKEEEEAERQRSSDGLDHFDVDDVATAAVTVRVELDDATPFSTPCGSPSYYTPSPSPSREELRLSTTTVHETYSADADREKVSFVSSELIGV